MIIITVRIYYFFRDPERFPINDDNYLVSPADGLVINISEQTRPIELQLENTTFNKDFVMTTKKFIDLNTVELRQKQFEDSLMVINNNNIPKNDL